jgi:hypothetical protein
MPTRTPLPYSCQRHERFHAIDFHDISPRRPAGLPQGSGAGSGGGSAKREAGPGPGRVLGLFKLNCLLGCMGAATGLISTAINIAIFLLAGEGWTPHPLSLPFPLPSFLLTFPRTPAPPSDSPSLTFSHLISPSLTLSHLISPSLFLSLFPFFSSSICAAVLQDQLARQSLFGMLLSMTMDLAFITLAAALCKHVATPAIGTNKFRIFAFTSPLILKAL